MDAILEIKLSVDLNNLIDSLFEIYKVLRPNCEKSKTVFKELKGGSLNIIYVLYNENEINEALVFRTYGVKKLDDKISKLNEEIKNKGLLEDETHELENVFSDHSKEGFLMHSLSKHNLCKPVHVKYLNGICFSYANGITSNGPLMLTNDFSKKMALKLAKFHSLKIETLTTGFDTHYDLMTKKVKPTIKPLIEIGNQELVKINEFPYNEYPNIDNLLLEEKNLLFKLKEFGMGEIVFCHNDLNQKNIIWDPQEKDLFFIDFEMSMNSYCAVELGTFFFSFTGHFLDDFEEDLIPNENYRLNFIRKYLEERYKLEKKSFDDKYFENEVKKIFIRSNLIILTQMIGIVLIKPFFDFKPEFSITDNLVKNESYSCGKYGLKVYKAYEKIKDNVLKTLDEYNNSKK